MLKAKASGALWLLVIGSFVFAFLVAVYPLSTAYSGLRPEIACLLVIYWILQRPQQFGVGFAWMVGLAQDVIEGVTWGGHALALAIVAYICIAAHQRIKNYSVWHQTIWIFVLVGFHQVIVNWVQSFAGYRATPLELILSTTVTALAWPLLFFCLYKIQFAYRYH